MSDEIHEIENFDPLMHEGESSSAFGSSLLPGIELVVADPVTDRKSIFVGRACRIDNPSEVANFLSQKWGAKSPFEQVPAVLSHLMSDRRIARAAHPIINAWRCTVHGISHQGDIIPQCDPNIAENFAADNDDDGESAAGGRLAHLLQILVSRSCANRFFLDKAVLQEVDNVLVIVTRYFGGIYLERIVSKHINQAARNALEAGGFLNSVDDKKTGRTKKRQ